MDPQRRKNCPVVSLCLSGDCWAFKPFGLAPQCDYRAHAGWQVNDGCVSFPKRRTKGVTALWNHLNTHVELTNGLTVFTLILVGRQLQVFNSWLQVWIYTTFNINCKIKNNLAEKRCDWIQVFLSHGFKGSSMEWFFKNYFQTCRVKW